MFEIVWSQKAKNSLQNTLIYWVNRNKSNSYSKKNSAEIILKQEYLKSNPYSCEETNYKGVRRIIILRNFSLFYFVDEVNKQIKILAFRDNRQKPKF